MAFDAFLYFQSGSDTYLPKGESTDIQFMKFNAFEIKSFSFSLQNNVTIGSGTKGAGAGRCVLEKFKFQKSIDRGSPVLFNACVAGKHIDAAVLVLRKAGGVSPGSSPPCYLVFKFLFCYVDTVSWSGSSGDDVPTEDVSFAYGAVQINYRVQSSQGTLVGTPFKGSWSQVANRAEFVVSSDSGGLTDDQIKLPAGAIGK
jgi:type VI secretion system secreted protein Hcp